MIFAIEETTEHKLSGHRLQIEKDADQKTISLWLNGKSKHTVRKYEAIIEEFVSFIAELGLTFKTCEPAQLIEFVSFKKDSKQATQSQRAAVVKSVFSFGVKIRRLNYNPGLILKIKMPDARAVIKTLTQDEIESLIKFLKKPRDRLLYLLFYETGARRSEIVNLNWGGICENRNETATVKILGKGNKTRYVRISTELWKELKSFRPVDARDNSPVFTALSKKYSNRMSEEGVSYVMKVAAAKAGINKKVSPHWLRHSHATIALQNGAPLKLLQETLGHADITTTSRYTHMNPEESSGSYLGHKYNRNK